MKPILFLFILFFSISGCKKDTQNGSPDAKVSDSVKIKISWDYRDFPIKMYIYEPPVQRQVEMWMTGSAKEKEKIPASIEIENSTFSMQPGSKKSFVLVAQNTTDKPIYFFAAPHHVTPDEFSLGFKFKCLCVNHAFSIPPGEFWYRVVELRMSKNFRGDNIDILHTLIGISEDRKKDFDAQEKQISPEEE